MVTTNLRPPRPNRPSSIGTPRGRAIKSGVKISGRLSQSFILSHTLMSTTNFSFWLFQRDGDSYTSKGRYSLAVSPYGTVQAIVQAARSHIPPEAQVGDLSIEVHEVRQS